MAFLSDGNQIVSGSSDNLAQMWNAKIGKQLRNLQGHTNTVTSVAFSFNNSQIISSSIDNSVHV